MGYSLNTSALVWFLRGFVSVENWKKLNTYAQSKNVQVKRVHSDQYARVSKHGRMLALFHPVIGLDEL
jgi:hypothetical protein